MKLQALLKNKGHHARYEALIANLLNAERLLQEGAEWGVQYVYYISTSTTRLFLLTSAPDLKSP